MAMYPGVRPVAPHPLRVQRVCQGMLAAAPPAPPEFTVGYRNQIFVARRDGGARRLTGGPTSHFSPLWSPSGGRIAATTTHGIVILSPGGRVRNLIDAGRDYVGSRAWAPRG